MYYPTKTVEKSNHTKTSMTGGLFDLQPGYLLCRVILIINYKFQYFVI